MSRICPITYDEFIGAGKYSLRGVRLLSRQLSNLNDLPYSAEKSKYHALLAERRKTLELSDR